MGNAKTVDAVLLQKKTASREYSDEAFKQVFNTMVQRINTPFNQGILRKVWYNEDQTQIRVTVQLT